MQDRESKNEIIAMIVIGVILTLVGLLYATNQNPETHYACTDEYIADYGSADCEYYHMELREESQNRNIEYHERRGR